MSTHTSKYFIVVNLTQDLVEGTRAELEKELPRYYAQELMLLARDIVNGKPTENETRVSLVKRDHIGPSVIDTEIMSLVVRLNGRS